MKAPWILAGLLVLSAPAQAAPGGPLTIVTGAPCGTFGIQWKNGLATLTRSFGGCSDAFGVGVNGFSKAARLGHAMMFSVEDEGDPGTAYFYQFAFPFVDGGAWTAYSTTDGQTFSVVGSGTYGLQD
jgi:hypothetical protein